MDWQTIREKFFFWTEDWRDARLESSSDSKMPKLVIGLLALYLLIATGIGMFWSMMPSQFPVTENAAIMAERNKQQEAKG